MRGEDAFNVGWVLCKQKEGLRRMDRKNEKKREIKYPNVSRGRGGKQNTDYSSQC